MAGGLTRALYRLLRMLGDARAASRGRYPQRAARRAVMRRIGRLLR